MFNFVCKAQGIKSVTSGGNLVKKSITSLLIVFLAAITLAGCKGETPQTAEEQKPTAGQEAAFAGKSGSVVETMNTSGYTYIQVDTGTEKFWAAAPEFKVAVGDSVVVPEGMPMTDYESKTLNRKFDVVYFVDSVMVGGTLPEAAAGETPAGHPSVTVAEGGENKIDLKGIAKAKGGKTVAELYGEKGALSGKDISVRGKVVKFSPQIMGTNWIHLQDGSGSEGTNDLTVTTDTTVNVGDTVLVTGKLTTDKDFGYGYKYDLIIEEAKVVVQ